MLVLLVCSSNPHAHDYGVDFLIQGFYGLLGASAVVEWPEKPNLHLEPLQERDACQIDSDAWLPRKGVNLGIARRAASTADMVVLTSPYGIEEPLAAVLSEIPSTTPIWGLWYGDAQESVRETYEHKLLHRPLTRYGHRERPPADAVPLFLSQPLSRVRPVAYKPTHEPHVFYHTSFHGWPPGNPRERLARSIQHALPQAQARVFMTNTQSGEGRLSPELYRERLWESAISVVWNSNVEVKFPVWDSNRLWESMALGCALVAERPMYAVPPHLSECVVWIDDPREGGEQCRRLLQDHLAERQKRTQETFVRHHASERRAAQLLAEVGLP